MTQWFDTNYHCPVPELGPDTVFAANSAKQVTELKEALAQGLTARPRLPVASYFDRLGDALPVLAKAPVDGLPAPGPRPAPPWRTWSPPPVPSVRNCPLPDRARLRSLLPQQLILVAHYVQQGSGCRKGST
ncbi:hypothetical protein [Streptomyces pseudogriseolus]|uniref:hypothetical protein n=1 Tax=Streptomyces pseudogriseolus TaxID=36817 RepID=UPI003FA1BE4E